MSHRNYFSKYHLTLHSYHVIPPIPVTTLYPVSHPIFFHSRRNSSTSNDDQLDGTVKSHSPIQPVLVSLSNLARRPFLIVSNSASLSSFSALFLASSCLYKRVERNWISLRDGRVSILTGYVRNNEQYTI